VNDALQAFRANLAHAIRNRTALTVGGGEFSGDELVAIRAALGEPATPEEIEAARAGYAAGSDDNIEIDDDARVSRLDGSNAYWVSAWVFLPGDDGDDDEPS